MHRRSAASSSPFVIDRAAGIPVASAGPETGHESRLNFKLSRSCLPPLHRDFVTLLRLQSDTAFKLNFVMWLAAAEPCCPPRLPPSGGSGSSRDFVLESDWDCDSDSNRGPAAAARASCRARYLDTGSGSARLPESFRVEEGLSNRFCDVGSWI